MTEMVSLPKAELEALRERASGLARGLSAPDREFNRALLESMSDGVVACDADGVLTLFNRAARQWHGADPLRLPPEEWPNHYNLYRADGVTPLPSDEVPLARAFRGEVVIDEGMAIAAVGQPVRFVLANGSAIVDERGRTLGAVVVMRDVTALRQVEAALRRANEALEARVGERTAQLQEQYLTLRGIVDGAAAPIFTVDRHYRYTSFNARHADVMRRLYGARLEIGGSLLEYMSVPEDRAATLGNLDRALAGESFVHEAFSGEDTASRQYFQVAHSPIRSGSGEVLGVAVFAHDLTERKRAEEQLKQSEQRYRDIFDNVLDGLYLLDVLDDGRFRTVEVNPALERMTGVSRSLSVGKTQEEIVPAAVARVVNEKYRRCVAVGQTLEEDATLDLPAGRRQFHTTLVPAHGADGRVTRLVGISRDVTEARRAEEERRASFRFFETMDRVNRAIQGAADLQSTMSDVLDVVLDVLGCDRAYLLFPCDPGADSWTVPMERFKPEYPGILAHGLRIPMDEEVAETFRILLSVEGPVKFGPGTAYALPADVSGRFGFKSLMATALRPRMGKAWQFGVHQCSQVREWTYEEERLLKEIGRRLADALTSLLISEDLRASEAKYRRIVDTAYEGICVLGQDAVIGFVNARMAEMLGYGGEALIGRPLADFIPVEEWPDHEAKMRNRRGLRAETYERQFHRQDGGRVWALVSAVPIVDSAGRFDGSFAMLTDITERKRAEAELLDSEAKLERSNRHLLATRDCNQMLIRATDEQTLLHDICRIICDRAGYRMAWVGYTEGDGPKLIRPAAVAGFDDGFVTEADLSWSDSDGAQSPAGTAVRSGTTIVVQDLSLCPAFAPCVHSAQQRGYRSAVWLPLEDETARIFGLLQIYSSEVNAFGPEDLELLEELAGDLAFGIKVLRDRGELERAGMQRLAHLRFLEAMDLVNQAIHRTSDLESIFSEVLDAALSIFACDRAWLVYPCDPATPVFRVPMERCRPEYSGTSAVGLDVPVVPDISDLLGLLRASDSPVRFGPGAEHPLPRGMAAAFHIQSQIAMAVYPKGDQAYAFGLHQCSHPRIWTADDGRLLQEIGRRMADGLSAVLAYRNLQESERRYRAVFENSPVSIWEEDFAQVRALLDELVKHGTTDIARHLATHPETVRQCASLVRVADVNQAALSLHGAVRKDELLTSLDRTFTPESFDTFRQQLVALWNGATRMDAEGVVQTLAGEPRRVTVYAAVCPGYESSLAKVLVSLVDITERKRAEEQLLKLSSAIEQSPVSIIIADVNGVIEFVNPKFTQLTGYTSEEVRGRNTRMLKSGMTPPAEYERLWATIARGDVWTGTFCNRKKSGVLFWEDATIAPIKGSDGRVTHYIAIKEDITDKRALEDQLRQAQKMEAIGTLAGGVAHDFNNILTAIIGYANLMEVDLAPDDPSQSSVAEILATADRAAQLTRGLLAFSRKQVIHPKPTDLNEVVRNVERLLRRLIGEDIELSTTLTARDLIVMADPGQIEQVLMNLATNARDAMPDGGRVCIVTRAIRREDAGGTSNPEQPNTHALIAVSDTGPGMDERTREKAFDPFFTTKEPGRGTGLGLAIVYGIVKQHGGAIEIQSDVGKGTSFEIVFPLLAAPAQEPKAAALAPPAKGTETILLAEDDTTVRDMFASVLRGFGYRVIEAVDGADALRQLEAHGTSVHMLVLDVVMPKKSGREVYDAARVVYPDIPVLFLSGYTADIIHKKGIFDEALQFIAKPLSPFDLLRRVRAILDARK